MTSLSAVDNTFKNNVNVNHDDPSTTNSLDQSSDIVEGHDNGLKWVKSQIVKQVGMFDCCESFIHLN